MNYKDIQNSHTYKNNSNVITIKTNNIFEYTDIVYDENQ